MKWLSLLFLFVFGVKLKETTADDRAKFKTVSTLLNAKWNSTPLALEISEFLNDEDPSFFWSFVEDVYKHTEPLSESRYTFEKNLRKDLMYLFHFQRRTKHNMKHSLILPGSILEKLKYH